MDDAIIITVVVIAFIYSFIFSLGAAKLSYKYNTNNGSTVAFLYSIWAFTHSVVYYPFYALVLDRD